MSSTGEPLPPYHRAEEYDDDGISLLWPLNFLLRHRVVVALTTAIGLTLGLVEALAQSRWYEASVSFVSNPGTGRLTSGVANPLSLLDQSDPFDYYSRILASASVADAVLDSELPGGDTVRDRIGANLAPGDGGAVDARELLATSGARLDSTNRLRRWDVLTVMTVRAGWTDPQTAADLTNAYVAALADFDKSVRSSTATTRRETIQKQVTETEKALKGAEDKLRVFKEQNRLLLPGVLLSPQSVGDPDQLTRRLGPAPPQLELGLQQLQREVTLQSELYVMLKKQLEQARIAESDEATSLVTIEPAVPPRSPSGPSRRRTVMMMGVIGFVAGLVLAGVFEMRTRMDLKSPEGIELAGHLATIRSDVARVGARTMKVLSAPSPPAGQQESKHDV